MSSDGSELTGADALIRTLVASGVEVCFTNPGTSEMHVVAALDRAPGMRAILGLFEGVVSGAADGYARMAEKPACTLLHLGPGLANGLANFHNARRARVPIVSLVGDHAVDHIPLDAPLTSDIFALATTVSGWVHASRSSDALALDAARAVAASFGPPPQIATLIVPADVAWSAAGGPVDPVARVSPSPPASKRVEAVAHLLRTEGAAVSLLMNGSALSARGLDAAGRVSSATDARLFADTFVTRMARGAGRVPVPKLPYYGPDVTRALAGTRHLVLVGTKAPVAFFAYPGEPGELTPSGCQIHVLADPEHDLIAALEGLSDALDAGAVPPPRAGRAPNPAPTGQLTAETVALAVAHVIPDGAVVMNEGATESRRVPGATAGAAPHDWLDLTGGAIGFGSPAATGAAVAAPERKVLALQADGSGMYTLQALWTQAREGLDVTTVILSNRKYAILEGEYRRTGAGDPTPKSRSLFELSRPDLDWVSLARGMGVPGTRVESAESLCAALHRGFSDSGPYLIEALL